MVYEPPMALSAPQTQVTPALFQKGSLPTAAGYLNGTRGPICLVCFHLLILAAQSQIKSLAHLLAASL